MNHDSLDFDATLQKLAAGNVLFDRYLLKRLIGKGRHGEVWEAVDQRLEQPVALKVLANYPDYDLLSQRIGRVIGLTHPSIIRTFDFAGDRALSAIVMELMPGPSLAQSLREKDPPFFEAAEVQPLARDLFTALDHAWRTTRIAHGDVRPSRLFVTKSGTLKLAGFPFACLREGRPLLTGTAADDGAVSLPCLSPQVVAGEPALHADDIYSAGACIYELMTGKPVFPGGNLILQIQRKTPPPMATRRAELERKGAAIPKALEQITARCLAKEREERPTSAADAVTSIRDGTTKTGRSKNAATSRSTSASRAGAGLLAHPLVVLLVVLAIGAGAFYALVLKPGHDEITRRRAEYNALSAADAVPQASTDDRIKDWQTFHERSLLKDVPFNDEDEKITALAEARLADLTKTQADERKALRDQKRAIEAQTEQLRSAIREEKKTNVPPDATAGVLASRVDAWGKIIAEHGAKGSPETEEFTKLIANATSERSKMQSRLDTLKADEQKKKAAEENLRLQAASWAQSASLRLSKVKSLCADEARSPAEKLDQINQLITYLGETTPEAARPEALRFKAEAETLRKEWAAKMAATTPKSALDIKQLFANSPYTEARLKDSVLKGETEKSTARFVSLIQKEVLAQAQEKIFAEPNIEFDNKKNAKADGAAGRTTHAAIIAYQSLPTKKLVPNAELDTATLAALGLDKFDAAAFYEKEKSKVAQTKTDISEDKGDGDETRPSKTSKAEENKIKPPSSGGHASWKKNPPPKSIYDVPMGKSRETFDRLRGKIDPVEWKKHQTWLQYCEWLDNQE